MRRLVVLLGLLWSGVAIAQAPDTLFISGSQTVHLRFASELKYVGLGSREIVAKIVEGSKDFVAVKARSAFEGVTSMSCLESNGAMHSFLVAYREEPGRLEVDTRGPVGVSSFSSQSGSVDLEEIACRPKGLYHLGVREHGLELRCENIFVQDDVLYLVMSLSNGSAVSYGVTAPRFSVESAKRSRRGLQSERAVFPRQAWGLGVVAPGAVGRMVFAFDKLALLRGQVLMVYFYEDGGARNLVLTVGERDVR